MDYYIFCNGGYRVTVCGEEVARRCCEYLASWHRDKEFTYVAKPVWDAQQLAKRGIIRKPPNVSLAPRSAPPARERSA